MCVLTRWRNWRSAEGRSAFQSAHAKSYIISLHPFSETHTRRAVDLCVDRQHHLSSAGNKSWMMVRIRKNEQNWKYIRDKIWKIWKRTEFISHSKCAHTSFLFFLNIKRESRLKSSHGLIEESRHCVAFDDVRTCKRWARREGEKGERPQQDTNKGM